MEFADLLFLFKYHFLLLFDLFDCFLLGQTCKFLHSLELVGQILAFGKQDFSQRVKVLLDDKRLVVVTAGWNHLD